MEPTTTITAAFVLSLMSRLPSVEAPTSEAGRRPGGWEKMALAGELAQSIADAVNADGDPLFGDRQFEASSMATWVVFEGGLKDRCASGDGGKSWGPFQLQAMWAPRWMACDSAKAAPVWIHLAHRVSCADRAPNEQLSAVASGNCGHGHVLTRRRFEHAKRALEAVIASDPPQE